MDATDHRAVGAVGRHARLELTFGVRAGRTVLEHAYAEPPFRAGHCFAEEAGAHLILAWVSPGVFGGDCLEQHVRVRSGAHVRLTSQSALQIHPSPSGNRSTLRATYDVEDGATLVCEWHPLIPFAGSRFSQQLEIRLGAGARLVWSDALMAGRLGRDERWAFAEFGHELSVYREGVLDYLERFRLTPGTASPDRPWVAPAANYVGTVLVSDPGVGAERAEALHRELSGRAGVAAAADVVEPGLLLVRLLGPDGPAFHEAREFLARSNASAVSCA